jgi:hypothetical protein
MNGKYTLNDATFRYALTCGSQSGVAFSIEKPLIAVGGASVQLAIMDEPRLYRPTTDIDLICRKGITKSERKTWRNYLLSVMQSDGHDVEGRLKRLDVGISFKGLKTPFMLHLDCFGPKFYQRHKKRFDAEFERAVSYKVDGQEVRAHNIIDIIANKLRRMVRLRGKLPNLDSLQRENIFLIQQGQFDDVEHRGLFRTLEDVNHRRGITLEEMGRTSLGDIEEEVMRYKLEKDLYDVYALIEFVRSKGKSLDRKTYEEAVRLVLEP